MKYLIFAVTLLMGSMVQAACVGPYCFTDGVASITGGLPASTINAGTLGSGVIVSSISNSAVGQYFPVSLSTGVVGSLPAASVAAGSLGSTVIASSITNSAVGPYFPVSLSTGVTGSLPAASINFNSTFSTNYGLSASTAAFGSSPFSTENYPISVDGSIVLKGGSQIDFYKSDGTTYQGNLYADALQNRMVLESDLGGILLNPIGTANGNVIISSTTQGAVTPDASSMLQVESNTKGFLAPRLTTNQRNAVAAPAEGLFIVNISSHTLEFFNGSVWKSVAGTDVN